MFLLSRKMDTLPVISLRRKEDFAHQFLKSNILNRLHLTFEKAFIIQHLIVHLALLLYDVNETE